MPRLISAGLLRDFVLAIVFLLIFFLPFVGIYCKLKKVSSIINIYSTTLNPVATATFRLKFRKTVIINLYWNAKREEALSLLVCPSPPSTVKKTILILKGEAGEDVEECVPILIETTGAAPSDAIATDAELKTQI